MTPETNDDYVHDCLCWDSAPGFWLLGSELCRVLVLEYDGDEEERKCALLLDDFGNVPAYTQLDLQQRLPGEWMGPARIRLDDMLECVSGAQVGRMLIAKGNAGITSVKNGRIKWLDVPQDLDLNDSDYGFAWSVEWEYREGREATVFQALDVASWLNAGWRRLPSARLS
jgi:hypothetical protein